MLGDGRTPLDEFLDAYVSAMEAVVPSEVSVGLLGDWILFVGPAYLDGWEARAAFPDPQRTTVRQLIGVARHLTEHLQEAVIRITTTPWPLWCRAPFGDVGHGGLTIASPAVSFLGDHVDVVFDLDEVGGALGDYGLLRGEPCRTSVPLPVGWVDS
jgi:hypothetical protein